MKSFEACLFDYGNTIIEFDEPQLEFIRQHLTQAIGRLVKPADRAVVARALDRVCSLPFKGNPPEHRELTPFQEMDLFLREVYGPDVDLPRDLVEEVNDALQDIFLRCITIDEGTVRFLSGLSQRIRLGLISNYPCGLSLRRSLKETGIIGFFNPILVSGDLGYVKPHPVLFKAALGALGLPAEKVLFVGDRWDADVVGPKDVGMKACHHVGYTSDTDLEERYKVCRPDFQIRRIEELEEILFPCGKVKGQLLPAEI